MAQVSVSQALHALHRLDRKRLTHRFDPALPREMKSEADQVLEQIIIRNLQKTGISICSEESGIIPSGRDGELRWLVDPLDGTVNFVRGLAACAVSIGLCRGENPIWGVIGKYPGDEIFWGGPGLGAFQAGKPLRVSSLRESRKAVLCTGFPSRFQFDQAGLGWMAQNLSPFGKVRMLGSASISLLQVAQGAADAYAENNIMLWDVAAGLAIVDGAGGVYEIRPQEQKNSFDVRAGNGRLKFPQK